MASVARISKNLEVET